MESMVNRWQKALQAVDELQHSRLSTSNKAQQSSKNIKDSTVVAEIKESKNSISLQDRHKDSRARGIQPKAVSRENRMTSNKKNQTPSKKGEKRRKKEDKILENSTNAIIQLFQPSNPDKFRLRLRSLLQNLLLQAGLQRSEPVLTESTPIMRSSERAYNQLQHRYLECEKQRQYLRGKLQMSAKRSQGLEREVERFGKVEKLIDQSISREAELRQELARAQHERNLLEETMRQQREIYQREVNSIRELVDSLKNNLPTD